MSLQNLANPQVARQVVRHLRQKAAAEKAKAVALVPSAFEIIDERMSRYPLAQLKNLNPPAVLREAIRDLHNQICEAQKVCRPEADMRVFTEKLDHLEGYLRTVLSFWKNNIDEKGS